MSTSKGTVQKLPSNDKTDRLKQALDETHRLEQALKRLRIIHSSVASTAEYLSDNRCFIEASVEILSTWDGNIPAHGGEKIREFCESCQVRSDSIEVRKLLDRMIIVVANVLEDLKDAALEVGEAALIIGGKIGD
jgi:hypothetical protein